MGNCASLREDVHVIVVGGGFAGARVAHDLDPYCKVTLIDKRESFFVNFGAVRAVVEPGFENTLWVDYKKVLKNGRFIQGEVTAVSPTSATVRLGDGSVHTVSGAQYVVLATGSTYGSPMKGAGSPAEISEQFARIQTAVRAAREVVIVGGGTTSVEVAGEIKAAVPTVNVTLVSRNAELLAGQGTNGPLSPKFHALLDAKLAKLGVRVVYNTAVARPAELPATEAVLLTPTTLVGTGEGSAAASFPSDVTFFLTGVTPTTQFLGASFPGSVDATGYVNITQTLNLAGQANVFVAGDIASAAITLAPKTSVSADAQGVHIVKSIRAMMAGKPAPLFVSKPTTMAVLVFGRNDAIGYQDGSLFPEFIVKMLKSKDYFAGKIRERFTGSSV